MEGVPERLVSKRSKKKPRRPTIAGKAFSGQLTERIKEEASPWPVLREASPGPCSRPEEAQQESKSQQNDTAEDPHVIFVDDLDPSLATIRPKVEPCEEAVDIKAAVPLPSVRRRRKRPVCVRDDCSRKARLGQELCTKHGELPTCSSPGCESPVVAQKRVCRLHGGIKKCQHEGCEKGAIGSSRHCSRHGGGHRCQAEGCSKGAAWPSTSFCFMHGGGKACLVPECSKGAYKGDYCYKHQQEMLREGPENNSTEKLGLRLCAYPDGCSKRAVGATDFCVKHGGGRRCKYEGCGKSAVGKDFCFKHGGGRRCQAEGCQKGAVWPSKEFCTRHGGVPSCGHVGCKKAALKNTNYCKIHGKALEVV